MMVAYRDGGRVGGIVRFDNRAQSEKNAHHFLDLLLAGIAMLRDCLLDLGGCVLFHDETFLGRRQDRDTARLTDSQSGCDISTKK